jgi:hypothetical protein
MFTYHYKALRKRCASTPVFAYTMTLYGTIMLRDNYGNSEIGNGLWRCLGNGGARGGGALTRPVMRTSA